MDPRTRLFVSLLGLALIISTYGLTTDPSAPTSVDAPGATMDPTATSSIEAEVRATVYALLNESSYAGNANDSNVQELVNLLMNGTLITDADLIRLGIIPPPQPPAMVITTPPPYVVPNQPIPDPGTVVVNPGGLDPNIGLPVIPQTNIPTDPTMGQGQGALGNLGIPTDLTGIPGTGVGTGASVPATQPAGTSDPFGSFTFPGGTAVSPPLDTAPPVLPPVPDPVPASVPGPAPIPGAPTGAETAPPSPGSNMIDPLNALSGMGAANPFAPLDPNALGPKPNSPLPTDILGGLTMPGFGTPPTMPNAMPPPSTGILDTAYQNRKKGFDPMMLMMMMNPEMMEGMGGENGMMMMFMLQQMNRNKQRRAMNTGPTQIPYGGVPASRGLLPTMGGPGPFGLPPTMGAQTNPGAGAGGFMDLLNSMGPSATGGLPGLPALPAIDPTGGAAGPLDPTGGAGAGLMDPLGAGAGITDPLAAGAGAGAAPPMDFASLLNPSPGAGGAPPADMSSFMNMINSPPMPSTGGNPTDPFAPVG